MSLRNQANILLGKTKEALEDLGSLMKNFQSYEDRIESLEKHIAKVEAGLFEKERHVNILKRDIHSLKTENEKLDQINDNLRAEVFTLRKLLQEANENISVG